MIKIEHIVEPSLNQMKFVIEGMRNPMNSWDKSDSNRCGVIDCRRCPYEDDDIGCSNVSSGGFVLGTYDKNLMIKLRNAGTDHRKFMRQMPVMMRITAPMYWWKEFDTYKVGTVANSTSTMHKIHAKEFTLDDFSCEHLDEDVKNDYLLPFIDGLNTFRAKYINTKDKCYWWQMIQLLPSSYNQTRNVTMNYENLLNMYHARKSHKLDEWREFCKVLAELDYSFLITGDIDGTSN